MVNFNELMTVCKETSKITGKVVDDFLLYYAAQRERLNKEMDQRLLPFRLAVKEFDKTWINLIKAQYIGHRIFKKNGFIKKYLNHAAIKELLPEQQTFLEQQSAIPWKYSFTRITGNPAIDFYEMEDAFTAEKYLIYSPSISQILSKESILLWFNLIGFNGSCWQTYGPVNSFSSFGPDDIFFFATELNPTIETDDALMADVENNPLPYLMLISGSRYPVTMNGEDEILQVFTEQRLESFDSSEIKKEFKVEYAQGIYRIGIEPWNDSPHFAQAFYVEDQKKLVVSSLTDRGYDALVTKLNKHAFGLQAAPDIRVRLQMLISIKHILGKEVRLNTYEAVFKTEPDLAAEHELDKLNKLLALALPVINAGQEPDFRALAKEVGVDEETAQELIKHLLISTNKFK
ncbi:MAG: hypothetical protein H7296_11900 [Bacteroidia bacterium]|nr:hypothetical protein [Bacteroidia bacterium]